MAEPTTTVAPLPAGRVSAYDPGTGSYVSIAEDEAEQAQARGWLLETPADRLARKENELYGTAEQQALAAVEGGLRGATFGGSDVVGEKLGLSEGMAARKRVNPKLSTGTEVLGSMAGLGKFGVGAKGVAGAAGLVARATTAPARAVLTAGRLAEEAVAGTRAVKALEAGGTAARALGSGVRLGLGGAVEGAAFGAGQVLSESALAGEHGYDDLAERLLVGAGKGATFGALAGGAMGATLSLGKPIAQKTADLLRRAAPGDAMANEAAVKAIGAIKSDMNKLATRPRYEMVDGKRVMVSSADAKIQQIGEDIRTYKLADGSDVLRAGDNATDVAERLSMARQETGERLGSLRKSVTESGEHIDATAYLSRVQSDVVAPLLNSSSPTIRAQGKRVVRELDALTARSNAFQESQSAVAKFAERTRKQLDSAIAASKSAGAREHMAKLAASVDDIAARAQAGRIAASDLENMVASVFRPLGASPSARMRAFANGAEKEAGALAKQVQPPVTYADLLEQQKALKDVVYAEKKFGGGLSGARGGTDHLQRAERMLEDTLGDHAETVLARSSPEMAGEYRKAKRLHESFAKAEEINGRALGADAGNRSPFSLTDTLTGGLVTAGQLAAGDVTAPLQGLAAGWLHRQVRDRGNSVLATMGRQAGKTEERIAATVRKFVRGGAATRRVALGVGAATEADESLGRKSGESRVEAFRRVAADVRKAAPTAPESVRVHAPATAAAMQATQARGIAFLRSKLPPSANGSANPLRPPLDPHPDDVDRYARYYRAVQDPMTVLDSMHNGNLTAEETEALRVVYPALFRRMQNEVTQAILEKGGEGMPYHQRLQLGLLLGVPTDAALEPSKQAAIQDSYVAPPAAPPPRGRMPPTKSISDAFATEADSLESGAITL